jgi:4-amino-4-deoxy-L-arabinose transferase-like glycosyltransferase
LLFTIILKLPSLRLPHLEFDERIYVTLAKQLYYTGTYSVQNTPLLKELAPEIYDRPLFFQPPLFVILSIPLILNFGDNSAVILSWIGHLLVLFSIFLFLRKIFRNNHLAIILIVAIAAADPIMVFSSRKIWLDSLAAGLAGISMYIFWQACIEECYRKKFKGLIISGVLLGAAILTKIPAILLGPFFALIFIRYHYKQPLLKNIFFLLAAIVPILAITFPWFFKTYSYYGRLIDSQTLPATLLETNKYLEMVTSRPFYYYPKEIILITPIILCIFYSSIKHIKKISFFALTLWISIFSVIGGYTYFAISHQQAYVMRYLTFMCVPFYLLLGLYLENRLQVINLTEDHDVTPDINIYKYTAVFLTLILSSMTSLFFIVNYKFDLLLSLYEILFP